MANVTVLMALFGCAAALAAATCVHAEDTADWRHPVGEYDLGKLKELAVVADKQPWAAAYINDLQQRARPWLDHSDDEFLKVLPRRRGQVKELFICPECRKRLPFDPFGPDEVVCPKCGQAVDTSQTCPETDRWGYHGTIWQGWAELWHYEFASGVWALGQLYLVTGDDVYALRAGRLLSLFAQAVEGLPVEVAGDFSVIYMYHREGDCRLIARWAEAYECIRGCRAIPRAQHEAVQGLLKRSVELGAMDPNGYETDWNDIYGWHRAVLLAGIACEQRSYIEFVFGAGDYSPEKLPDHRSLHYVIKHHLRPDDGTFWENTTGYDFAAYVYMAQMLVAGHMLSEMDPGAFPAAQFDFVHPTSVFHRPMRRALYGYLGYCLPDGTQIVIGDYGQRYPLFTGTAPVWNVGRAYLGMPELAALSPEMTPQQRFYDFVYPSGPWGVGELPHRSALMPRGLAVLRSGEGPGQIYAGLPHLLPGGGHQHPDRLNLVLWAQGRLLVGEKRSGEGPRPHQTHRLTSAHNLVVIDGKDQSGKVTPRVHHFMGSPWLQMVDVSVDGAYSLDVYRRTLFLVDGVLVDVFRAAGGEQLTRDWLLHPYGDDLKVELPLQAGEVDLPPEYVELGRGAVRGLRTDQSVAARWRFSERTLWPDIETAPQPCVLRTTVLGAPDSEVFTALTRPYATRTLYAAGPEDWTPPIHSLIVRRRTSHPFVAVHDVAAGSVVAPLVSAVDAGPGVVGLLVSTDRQRTLVLHAQGDKSITASAGGLPGVTLAGQWAVVQWPVGKDTVTAAAFHGTRLTTPGLSTRIEGEPATLSVGNVQGEPSLQLSGPVAYHTIEGREAPRGRVDRRVSIAFGASGTAAGSTIELSNADAPDDP